jgi:anti-sigma regulatory factor (Ser/Thr protein kinase)
MAADVNTERSKHIQLSNNTNECQRLYDFLAQGLDQVPVTKEFRHDLKLVAEELLANIINHGYEDNSEARIDIELAVDENSVRITFTDSGPAFNPLTSQAREAPSDLSEGGMGILLVKSLTDEQYYKRENKLNVFTVTKNYNT